MGGGPLGPSLWGARLFMLSSYPSARAAWAARAQPPGGLGMVEDFGEEA